MKPAPPSQRSKNKLSVTTPEQSKPTLPEDKMFPIIPPSGDAPYLESKSPIVQAREDEYPHESEMDEAQVNRFVSGDEFSAGYEFAEGDSDSLCESCKFCWSMRKRAEVKNLDVHGQAFVSVESYCTAIDHSLFSLNDRHIYECNKFQLGDNPRVRRKSEK